VNGAALVAGALVGLGLATTLLAFVATRATASPRVSTVALGRPVDRFGLRAGLAVLGAAIGALTTWPSVVFLAAIAGFCAPGLVGRRSARGLAVDRTEAIAAWTESLRDLISAGSAIESTIAESARLAPPSIRAEVRQLADRLANNEDLDAALAKFAADIADPVADVVVAALATASSRQGGAHLSDVLTAGARAARAQVAMRHTVEASRAGTYTSARVVVSTFSAFAVGLVVLNRSFLEPFGTAVGQLMILVIGGLFAVCAVAMVRLAEPEKLERFYGAPSEATS
jgi:tight adherence protein B